jgi:hypothetical protein
MRPVVFLDFDDVIAIHDEHNSLQVVSALKSRSPGDAAELWAHVFHAELRANLKTLYDAFSPQFVISSTWATYLSREQISEVLTRGGLAFVASALHQDWHSAIDVGSFRANEISTWLKQNEGGAGEPIYVILDDTSSGSSIYGTPLESRTVFCKEWQGFVESRLVEAQKILREQLST